MRNVQAFSLLVSMCLMGCLDSVSNRELTGSDGEAARQGLNDALTNARLADLDVGTMTDGLAPGHRLKLALPGADPVELVIERVQQLLPGVTTFSGHLADDESSDFTFSIEAGKLVGAIHQGTQAWLVEPHRGSNQHVVRTIDRTMLPKDEPASAQSLQRTASTSSSTDRLELTTATLSNGEVRVLFLYASDVTNPGAQAANIVAAFNNSLSLSAVSGNNFLTIAGVQQIDDVFDNQSRDMIRNTMNARGAPFTNLNAAMTAATADIAFLLVSEDLPAAGESAVWGRVGGVANILDQNNPFALSTQSYALGDLTALHEIGHVFGGQHEDYVGAGAARPVVAANGTWMTVMGGYIAQQCQFNGLPANCVRLNRWSNPDQTYMGSPLGVAGQSDMESQLEGSMPTVSNWGAEWVASAPAVLTSPPPGSTLPGATVTFSWTTGTGVLQYYLYVGNAPGGYDLYAASQGLATSGTVTGLPTDGRTLYVRLWSYTNNLGWMARDYTYTAANQATPAAITSPAPGSTLPAAVTFYWTTGSGVSQYYLYVGSSPGGYDLYAASQGLATSGTVTGLPTDGRTLYVRIWSYINSAWQWRDYTYAASIACHPLTGTHGQLWTSVSVSALWLYHDGWCTVGNGLPQQCWDGTYYYYQNLQSSSCSSVGSSGSCYDGNAWWWVTCNALVDCIYNCSGQCVKASC